MKSYFCDRNVARVSWKEKAEDAQEVNNPKQATVMLTTLKGSTWLPLP